MRTLPDMYHAALIRGDQAEADRLARLMQRLDDLARAYGRKERGE